MKLNDLPQVAPASIIRGGVWQYFDASPWVKPGSHTVKIIDVRDGWVRYAIENGAQDERMTEESFRQWYKPTDLYATGDLLKAPVPRDELEAALADMLSAFYYHAPANFAVRDEAIRRAQLALGAKVTL